VQNSHRCEPLWRKGNNLDRVILTGIGSGAEKQEYDPDLEEMKGLIEAAGLDLVMVMLQPRYRPDRATCIGKGKLTELKHLVDELEADPVIFNLDLSPLQIRNLEQALEIPVVDRTMLILEIFKQRAHSHEGKLQVELASLQYQLPRLTGRGRAMSRLGGGSKLRGAGEQQLELDRRYIRKRIQDIKSQLAKVEKTRQLHSQRRQRQGLKTASLVGYTNAGKSSLFNTICSMAHSSGQAQVAADQRLFQTLDTTTRKVRLPSGREVLLSDTVGFINQLPHHLVAAFRSTLKETVEADLLLHVVDRADPLYLDKMTVVEEVLEDLKVGPKPILVVFNKSDLLDPDMVLDGDGINVSAHTGFGVEKLLETIDKLL
jgi:GTP-binding protein HflX